MKITHYIILLIIYSIILLLIYQRIYKLYINNFFDYEIFLEQKNYIYNLLNNYIYKPFKRIFFRFLINRKKEFFELYEDIWEDIKLKKKKIILIILLILLIIILYPPSYLE